MEGSTRPLVATGRAEQGLLLLWNGDKMVGCHSVWGHSEPEWHREAPAPGQDTEGIGDI